MSLTGQTHGTGGTGSTRGTRERASEHHIDGGVQVTTAPRVAGRREAQSMRATTSAALARGTREAALLLVPEAVRAEGRGSSGLLKEW